MKSRILIAMIAAFATVLATGEAQAATCAVPSVAHPTIQSAVNDPSCDPINVAPGIYPENVMINRSLTLNGAQAGNPVAGRVFAVGESTIAGTGAPAADITILAANVTIDGFSLTNPGQNFGILVKTAGDNADIINNIIQDVGVSSLATNPAGIYLERGPDGVSVVGNRIANVQSAPTAQGILVGDSTSPNPSLDIVIRENAIEDITSGTRGAYGIQINNGASSVSTATGFTTVAILGNAITRLTGGGWAHAIGLEGDTPDVIVVGNSVSVLLDLTPVADMQDAIAVFFEANPSFPTAKVNQNNFDVTIAAYGIAVHPALIAANPGGSVDGTCNWWGDPNGPGPVGPGLGAQVSTNVDFTPWLTAPAPVGACVGGAPPTPGKATGGGQIEGDPVFSLTDSVFFPIGTLLSVPALVPSVNDPNERATFGLVARCCAASGNLEYNDHAADVRIKARSVDGLSITPATVCTAPGGRHATITGMADVIRSTGTTSEPFTVEVDDCGEPGTSDTFGIRTITYTNGPKTLTGGNIKIQ